MKENDRSFQVFDSSIGVRNSGRYVAETAQGAAHHAARILFRLGGKTHSRINFSLRECTRGSKQKIYKYVAVIKPRSKPQTWTVKDSKTGREKQLTSSHEIKVFSRSSDA